MLKTFAAFTLVTFILLQGCQSRLQAQETLNAKLDSSAKGTVVLLHGMWRTAYAMKPVAKYFADLGYQIESISYPSTDFDIPTLAQDYLAPVVARLKNKNQPVHFVTHSMGGILVRYYLQENTVDNLGRVVMLAPPNHGSELVDSTSGIPFSEQSPAAKQLSAAKSSWVQQLAPVEFELGVIAGDGNGNVFTDTLLPGPDDGVVTVASTKVENMRDFLVVPLKHYYLRSNPYVLQQSAHFIQYGFFDKPALVETNTHNMPNRIWSRP